ncbi:MAG: ComF family protein [Treponema sp.]|nr:ComF family protein [Treponema sp.]
MEQIVFLLREHFFPSGCALCGKNLSGAKECWYGLCENCAEALKKDGPEGGGACGRCDCCGRPLVSERGRCMECRNGEAPCFDRIVTLYPYRGICRKLLGAWKFGKNLAVGHFLAESVGETLARIPEFRPGEGGPVLVPVPPRPGKIRSTGWDQVEHLTRLLEKKEGPSLPVSRCLRRLPAMTQKKLDRERRRQNLRGKIVIRAGVPETAILLDDVITTGSTMDACAAALKAGGARKVLGICLFYS